MHYAIMANKIAPGIPNKPTNTAVIAFMPICNPHAVPIKFIMYNNIIPIIEFTSSFIINFIGTIKIFPTIIIPIKQHTYINIIFISTYITSYNIYIILAGQI